MERGTKVVEETVEYIHDKTTREIAWNEDSGKLTAMGYDLSVRTGAQVVILAVSQSGRISTFSTPKLSPMVTSEEGKSLIHKCLNNLPETRP